MIRVMEITSSWFAVESSARHKQEVFFVTPLLPVKTTFVSFYRDVSSLTHL